MFNIHNLYPYIFLRILRQPSTYQDCRRCCCQTWCLAVASYAANNFRVPILWRFPGYSSVGGHSNSLCPRKKCQLHRRKVKYFFNCLEIIGQPCILAFFKNWNAKKGLLYLKGTSIVTTNGR